MEVVGYEREKEVEMNLTMQFNSVIENLGVYSPPIFIIEVDLVSSNAPKVFRESVHSYISIALLGPSL